MEWLKYIDMCTRLRIVEKISKNEAIHFPAFYGDITLCGITTSGDLDYYKSERVQEKVNCSRCINIVRYVRDININEIVQ